MFAEIAVEFSPLVLMLVLDNWNEALIQSQCLPGNIQMMYCQNMKITLLKFATYFFRYTSTGDLFPKFHAHRWLLAFGFFLKTSNNLSFGFIRFPQFLSSWNLNVHTMWSYKMWHKLNGFKTKLVKTICFQTVFYFLLLIRSLGGPPLGGWQYRSALEQ